MSSNVLLISDVTIKERTSIHGNIDPKLLYPDIKYAQDTFITPVLGSSLDNKLKDIIKDGSISSDASLAPYKKLLDEYLVDALIYYTLAELPISLSFQFWNKGVVRRTGEDTELPSMSEMVDISNKYRVRAENYANRMRLFLIQNSGSPNNWYPEYLNPGNTIDSIFPKMDQFTMPLWLGTDRGCEPNLCTGRPWQPYKE